MLIALNPGHFVGADPGAVSAAGVQEAVVVRAVGHQVQTLLAASGVSCLWLESNELGDIVAEANAGQADYFISLHANAAVNPFARGCETFYCPGSQRGQALAATVQASLVANLTLSDRGCKAADFYVLRQTAMPAVLCELAFLTNVREAACLAAPSWQQIAAGAVAEGVFSYLAELAGT